jgi:hypothetical protein
MLFVLFHHTNSSFPGEKWLSYTIITPSLHRAHHSTLRRERDSNYGVVLPIWGILFGARKELIPKKIGSEMIEAENFVQLFSLAFITEGRLARLLHLLPRRDEPRVVWLTENPVSDYNLQQIAVRKRDNPFTARPTQEA